MVSSQFHSFNGQNPYEGINEYMHISRRFDKLVAEYKATRHVSRVSKKTLAKLIAKA